MLPLYDCGNFDNYTRLAKEIILKFILILRGSHVNQSFNVRLYQTLIFELRLNLPMHALKISYKRARTCM